MGTKVRRILRPSSVRRDAILCVDNDHQNDQDLIEEEDYLTADNWSERRHNAGQRAPLLTGIEAPAVTLAESEFNPHELLESARPKSSMSSAFMNMANSIM